MKLDSILVVDDSQVDLEIVSIACSTLDCTVDAVSDAWEAFELYKERRHTIVIADYVMEPMTGIELITKIKEFDPQAKCLIMSGSPKAQVFEFVEEMGLPNIITKPIRPANLTEQLRVALYQHRGATEQLGDIAISNRMDCCVALLGQSPQICGVRKQIAELLNDRRPLFIEGPYGIGKPDIIHFIHRAGSYANSTISICCCQELSTEVLEEKLISADGRWGTFLLEQEHGTLAINHIEFMPLPLQQALAREMKKISENCHIIVWSNSKIDDLFEAGRIDVELYFELSLKMLHVAPLSERPTDIEEIVRHILSCPEEFELKRALAPVEIDLLVAELRRSELAGNLRELIHRVKEACEKQEAVSVT